MYTVNNTTVLATTKNNIFYIIQRKIDVVTLARDVTVNLVLYNKKEQNKTDRKYTYNGKIFYLLIKKYRK